MLSAQSLTTSRNDLLFCHCGGGWFQEGLVSVQTQLSVSTSTCGVGVGVPVIKVISANPSFHLPSLSFLVQLPKQLQGHLILGTFTHKSIKLPYCLFCWCNITTIIIHHHHHHILLINICVLGLKARVVYGKKAVWHWATPPSSWIMVEITEAGGRKKETGFLKL